MNPFKITCVTCHARLTVRDEAAIGKILACPRCSSMVHVARPDPTGAATALLPAATERRAHAPAPAAAVARDATPTFDEAVDLGVESAPPLAAADGAALATPSLAPKTAPVAPTTSGWSFGTLAGLAAGSALAGSAVVALALTWLSGDGPSPANDAAIATPTDAPAGVTPDQPASNDEGLRPPVATEPATAAPEGPLVANPSDEAPLDPPLDANPFAPPPAESSSASAASAAVAPEPSAEPAPAAATADAPAAESAAPQLRIDPLEFDPEGLDLSTLLTSDASHPSAPTVGDEAAPAAVVSVPPNDEPAAASEDPAGPAAPPVDDNKPHGAPEALLARRLPAVKVDDMPLCQFLPFVTSLSGLPVSVAPEDLRLAAVAAAAPVSVNVTSTTIEELLTKALGPLRLAPEVQDGQIVLKRAVGGGPRELTYPIGDLDVKSAEIVAWIQGLVEPASWASGGGSGKLTIDGPSLRIAHTERIGYEAILFLEQYRSMRGLALRSKYPQDLLADGSGAPELDARMTAPATFTFSRPTLLAEVVRWWQQELGVAVLVDWPALARERIVARTRFTAAAVNQPWGEALTAALEPLGLGWRAVAARTIEISTLESINSQPRLAMHRVAADAPSTVAHWRAEVAHLGGAQADATVFFDAAHRILLVRQPVPVQQALAKRLGSAQP